MATLSGSASAQVLSVTLDPPARDFGILVGDLMTSSAVVTLGPDTALDRRSLPQPGPAGASLDIRTTEVSVTALPTAERIEIRVTYQSFLAPEQVSQATVPGYMLGFVQGGRRLTAAIPGFTYTVSPFRHDLTPVLDPAVLRPDRPALLADTGLPTQNLVCGSLLALLGAAALLARRRLPGMRARGPFAIALHGAMRGSAGSGEAWLELHRAFDATAGRRVLADDLDAFVTAHPRFDPLRADIEQFFVQSRAIFFGDGTATPGTPLRIARALARAERRR